MNSFELIEDILKKMHDEQIITKSRLGTIYKPTGKKLKRFRFYIEPDSASTLKNHTNNSQCGKIQEVKKCNSSNYLMDVRATEDVHICLVPLMEYVPCNFEPVSPVIELHDADTKAMLSWSKS